MYVKLIPLVYPNKGKVFPNAHCIRVDHLEHIVVLDSEAREHVFPLSSWRVFVSREEAPE